MSFGQQKEAESNQENELTEDEKIRIGNIIYYLLLFTIMII